MNKNRWNRLKWTAIQAAGGALLAAPVFGIEAAKAAGYAALTAVVAAITLIARRELDEE